MSQTFFATINPGLEPALLEEVRELGGRKAKALHGGVEFQASNVAFYKLLLRLRCANRVVLRIDEFRARDFPELFNKASRIDWGRFIGDLPVEVKASARTSRLIHSGRIAATVQDAVNEGRTLAAGEPIAIFARIEDDRCTLSLDASGPLLYQRGWKHSAAPAPIRESLASALMRISGWSPTSQILDPTCGSGTFVIEAAERSQGLAAGRLREFALERWVTLREDAWLEARAEARTESSPSSVVHLGFDVSPDAVSAARKNAASAGLKRGVAFEIRDVAELVAPGPEGWVMCNPPYGMRLDEGRVMDTLLRRFERFGPKWSMGLVYPAKFDPHHPALRREALARFSNGGIDVVWWKLTPT